MVAADLKLTPSCLVWLIVAELLTNKVFVAIEGSVVTSMDSVFGGVRITTDVLVFTLSGELEDDAIVWLITLFVADL